MAERIKVFRRSTLGQRNCMIMCVLPFNSIFINPSMIGSSLIEFLSRYDWGGNTVQRNQKVLSLFLGFPFRNVLQESNRLSVQKIFKRKTCYS